MQLIHKRLNVLSSELKGILQNNFRDDERINTILLKIFSNKFFVECLSLKFNVYKKLSKMNKYSSFENFLQCSESDNIDVLKNNVVREHALFIILKNHGEGGGISYFKEHYSF